ncbi:right-handed parallel beta-helix repeat-containing protein [Micromonospora chersina]|uniref:right-handed parallel beta-helix repeat-containing protein n=1 Tax=Micromonospora chersina TaxID=47854 RepID=UPI0033B3BF22
MRKIVILALAALSAVVPVSTGASAAEATRLVVDDDGQQCGGANFTTIQAAVDAAAVGDTVHVCPGRYTERVVVNKPLTIRGQPDSIEAVDCHDPTPSQLDDVDTTLSAVVQPPDTTTGSLFTLTADNVELAGLVIQGLTQSTPIPVDGYPTYNPAVTTNGDHAGYQIHHNLIRLNTFGIELGSNGTAESRIHHNCLRQNRWAIANQRYVLKGARIDHNATFKTEVIGYEIGWGYAGTERVVLDHNTSQGDAYGYVVEDTTATSIDRNTVEPVLRGIWVFGGNTELRMRGNAIRGGTQGGIYFSPPRPTVPDSTAAPLVHGNTITGNSGSGIILSPQATVMTAEISGNVTNQNAFGIQLFQGNTQNVLRGNTADGNRRLGIRTGPGATGNRIESNQMLGNGEADARDDNFIVVDGVTQLGNNWLANICERDYSTGNICGTSQ